MRKYILFILLCITTVSMMGQGTISRQQKQAETHNPSKPTSQKREKTRTIPQKEHERKCPECGLALSKCQYEGRHPEPEAAGYDVIISCNVSSANLYIDGKNNGEAYGTHFLKTGTHAIRIEDPSYEEYNDTIVVDSNNKAFSFTLKKRTFLQEDASDTDVIDEMVTALSTLLDVTLGVTKYEDVKEKYIGKENIDDDGSKSWEAKNGLEFCDINGKGLVELVLIDLEEFDLNLPRIFSGVSLGDSYSDWNKWFLNKGLDEIPYQRVNDYVTRMLHQGSEYGLILVFQLGGQNKKNTLKNISIVKKA